MEDAATERLLEEAAAHEIVPAALALRLARAYERAGDVEEAVRWAVRVTDAGEEFAVWQAASAIVRRAPSAGTTRFARAVRVGVLGSYNTSQLTALLPLAGAAAGVRVETYESDYGQYRQEILDPSSRLFAFRPDVVVLAVHEGDLDLAAFSDDPERDVAVELDRWVGLWTALRSRTAAIVVQHGFATPPESPFGHLGSRLGGSRLAMVRELNRRLGMALPPGVTIVDCDSLAANHGKDRWFDARYWHLAKQAVSLTAVPLLARETIAVLAAELGLTKKCIVLDLDNTLWGGVVGEDGLAGIRVGEGSDGEAYAAFQDYLLRLKERGVLLAVASKNNDADAREPFLKHPGMRIRLDDIAAFVATWDPKPDQLRQIAATLNIGTDSLVFVDDNPVEREALRQLMPEVEVVQLPPDPADYVRAIARCRALEPAAFTAEDRERTAQYRARNQLRELETTTSSLDELLRSLRMTASVGSFDAVSLPRIAQLVNKTNQFNLTTRRHSQAALEAFARDPACVHFSVRLRDRFADHGLIAVLVAFAADGVLEIDTWLMSCRVIGRTVEELMLAEVADRARRLACREVRGTYRPSPKNAMVADLYERLGFRRVGEADAGTTRWSLDLEAAAVAPSAFIETTGVAA